MTATFLKIEWSVAHLSFLISAMQLKNFPIPNRLKARNGIFFALWKTLICVQIKNNNYNYFSTMFYINFVKSLIKVGFILIIIASLQIISICND